MRNYPRESKTMTTPKTYKDQAEREDRNQKFRAIVAGLPGETKDDKLREVCELLHCELNTARMWASNSLERVVTSKDLAILKVLLEVSKKSKRRHKRARGSHEQHQ